MTQQEIKRALNLVRYGGVVITVTVFVALLAFAIVAGRAIDSTNAGVSATSSTFNSLLPYILGLTVVAAILSVVLFFAYRAYLMGKAKS
jgi:hypothetical protein